MHEQGVLTIGRWLVVSPLEVLRQNGMLFLGGLAMVPLLVLWIRRPVLRRALLFAAVPLACNFVPFFATVLIREGSYLIARTLLNVPVFPIIVLGFAAFVTWSRARGWGARAVAAVVLIAWSLTFVAPAVRALDLALSSPPRAASPPASRELVDYVRHLPAESVILSDTRTSYYLSALTVHRFVAVHGQHANPLDPYALDRLQAVRDVLSPYVVSSRALEACRRYGVDFVVCNAASGSRGDEFMSTWDVHDYPLTVARLESIAGRFRLVHRGEKFVVFLYDPSGTGSSTWGPPRTLVSYAPVAGMEQCVVVAPDGAFRITGVAATPQHALPGESIAVTLGYEKSRERAFGIPFVLHLRLDHESIERERDYPLAKHVRRFQERRRGVSERVTVRHVPFGGRYDVDLWPIGRDFYETVEVALPTNLLPGRYTLRVSIERSSLLPNFALGDLLYNHDRLHGVACTSVEVSRQRVRGP
jgi:hypothetical protein